MPDLIPFSFDSHTVRVLLDDMRKPWWVAQDVCQVLGLPNTSQSIRKLQPHEKGVNRINTLGGPQDLSIINETGLYRLIFRSDKPDAQRFQDWVFTDVLPQIRKTGSYGQPAPRASEQFPELRAIGQLVESIAETRLELAQVKADAHAAEVTAARAEGKADMAIQSQEFYTVAEYVYFNKLQRQLPESAYKACSDHLMVHCMEQRIPTRRIPVGNRKWDTEYGYPITVWKEVFPEWLFRRNAQGNLRMLPPKAGESS